MLSWIYQHVRQRFANCAKGVMALNGRDIHSPVQKQLNRYASKTRLYHRPLCSLSCCSHKVTEASYKRWRQAAGIDSPQSSQTPCLASPTLHKLEAFCFLGHPAGKHHNEESFNAFKTLALAKRNRNPLSNCQNKHLASRRHRCHLDTTLQATSKRLCVILQRMKFTKRHHKFY